MIRLVYFNLIYIDNHKKSFEKISIAVRNITTIFDMAKQIFNTEEKLFLLLFEDGTIIDENEYLHSLNDDTDLLICTEEQFEELFSGYFLLKRALSSLN